MCVMACVNLRHHCIFPIGSFLQTDLAYNLALAIAIPMALYSLCCCCISHQLWTFLYSSSNRLKMFWVIMVSWSAALYCWTILGSSHFNLWAFNGTRAGIWNHPRAVIGRSIQTALWSLGTPLPNARYPDFISGISCVGRNILSIGVLPRLWVFGPWLPCCVITASAMPSLQKADWIGALWMSSLMSAMIITVSPSSCHSKTWVWILVSMWFCGQSFFPCCESHWMYCWYVVRWLSALHGQ